MSKRQTNGTTSKLQEMRAAIAQRESAKARGQWFAGWGSFKGIRFEVRLDPRYETLHQDALMAYSRAQGQDDLQRNKMLARTGWPIEAQQHATRAAVRGACLGRVALLTEAGAHAEPAPDEVFGAEDVEWYLSRLDFVDQVVIARRELRNGEEAVALELGKPSSSGFAGIAGDASASEIDAEEEASPSVS